MTEHDGSLLRIYDSYCMNPSCKCGEAHLTAVRVEQEADHAAETKPLFSARLHFEGGLGFRDVSGPPGHDAVAFLSEWLWKSPGVIVEIEERYRRIKAVGKRLLKGRGGRT